jgi:uncharacterized membrane protein required for colicin V production
MVFNLIALLFVLGFVAIGSKKGFVRELMGLIGLAAALIITTGKLDFVAVEIGNSVNASPLVLAIIAYVLVLGLLYAIFKVAAKFLYKAISVQKIGERDKYGGAIVGAIRGWLIVGAVIFVTILMPLPRSYYTLLDQSVLATSAAKSIQIIYDTSKPLHQKWPPFLDQMDNTLNLQEQNTANQKKRKKSKEALLRDMVTVRAARDRLAYFYGDAAEY